MKKPYKILVGRLETKESYKRKWEGDIKMGHKEIGCEGVDWILLSQGEVQWWDIWTQLWTFGLHRRQEIY
jgi:hypothetical protein